MEDTIDKLIPICRDTEKLREHLKNKDPCFGRGFKQDEKTCRQCRMPVLLDGEIYLCKEVCQSLTEDGEQPAQIKNLGSNDVLNLIKSGRNAKEIIDIMIGDEPSYRKVKKARQKLANRLSYIKNKAGVPVPELPTVKELWENEF